MADCTEMNIMRKFRGGTVSATSQDEANSNPQHTALGLMHLKKLFSEYSHPPHPLSDKEKDDKLYNMLPLFCKVFGNSPSSDMMEKFRDILSFCHEVSRLMVTEMRRRASNQSTEAASSAIVKFLEIENCEESSNGWMLLSALNLLTAGDASLIQVMTTVSVPSTLVKCLYLFFDLLEIEDPDTAKTGSDFTPKERRILLQKIFVQVLVRLCSHTTPAEELARKDDLTLLFSAITSWCPPHNVMWRKSAAEVLMTLSRHGLSQPVVSYIHQKSCVALCIDNMQRVPELSPLEIVEMFVAVFCFLKDSSEVSQTLLDDFRSCQGYLFLSEFLLKLEQDSTSEAQEAICNIVVLSCYIKVVVDRLEQDSTSEAQEAIRNLVLMVASLSMCGYIELRPSQASMGSLFQMMGFTLPLPSGRGASVRNIQAFQVLQSVFLKSNSAVLCCTILDAISSVYHADNANYFILEGQHTLSQFAEKIHLKPQEIQEKFFQLLEFIVFQLNFVPCKELISLSILLKGQTSVKCSITCIQTLLNILRHNPIFKDVYREVGILEVFVTCLHRYAALLKEKQQAKEEGKEYEIPALNERLGMVVMEALTLLLSGNTSNAGVFRECGGARCAHNLVPYWECRTQALGIVGELILSTGGDDDMGTLLGMMHSAPASALTLKAHILKSLLMCLRESHRTRTVFRKVGGFVYVMSVLVSMEGCLKEVLESPWDTIPREEVFSLLHMVFNTVTVAMRFEPANAKFFHQEICMSSLCDTLRLLGCFSSEQSLDECDETLVLREESTFHNLFTGNVLQPSIPSHIPAQLAYTCIVLRLLYDVALDSYDKPNNMTVVSLKSPTHRRHHSESQKLPPDSPVGGKRTVVNSLNLTPPAPDPIVVHPGVVVAMLHLLPSIQHPVETQVTLTLQMYTAEVLKSLVRSERNQQVMCEAGLPGRLLSCGSVALEEETHPLHPPLQYMLERLATQCLEPKDLRDFLRLGDPLCSLSIDEMETCYPRRPPHRKPGGPVPLTRVKTLVSMTTPRDFRAHSSTTLPPFVELDMSAEGFGCLYLPSVAPQSPSGTSVVPVGALGAAESNVVGGIGTGDRMFPPQTGLSYSTWLCVDKFSDPRTDPHCVRLLTMVRNLHGGREDHLVCLSLVLSARDKAIIVSTQETVMPHNTGDWEPEGIGDSSARVWCPDLLHEGQWHHLVLVLNRAVLKNSSFSLYVDGQHVQTRKLHYISQNPGGGAANLTVASSVYSYIGTPPAWRRYSRLAWKQGPCHLVEEVLSPQVVATLYHLGPQYLGSLQAPQLNGTEPLPALVTEEKAIFGLNAKAVSQLTLAKIRKVYSKADNKAVAKQVCYVCIPFNDIVWCMYQDCGKYYYSANALNSHYRIHQHKEEELRCQWGTCNKLFDQPCRLKAHMRSHTGDKPYSCLFEGCGGAFSTASKLKRHQMRHYNLRKFRCTFKGCSKMFLRSEHLREHMHTHLGQRSFQCPVENCGVRFSARSTLYVHHKKHLNKGSLSEKVDYHCPIEQCSKSYSSKSTLRQHMLMCHTPILASDSSQLDYIALLTGDDDLTLDGLQFADGTHTNSNGGANTLSLVTSSPTVSGEEYINTDFQFTSDLGAPFESGGSVITHVVLAPPDEPSSTLAVSDSGGTSHADVCTTTEDPPDILEGVSSPSSPVRLDVTQGAARTNITFPDFLLEKKRILNTVEPTPLIGGDVSMLRGDHQDMSHHLLMQDDFAISHHGFYQDDHMMTIGAGVSEFQVLLLDAGGSTEEFAESTINLRDLE
uniref:C2H2-type domain-containing protein n=1 Tax=Timema genevievae TaxID=629358 RepID=A0A7R9PK18_TIMGE|nr:unnamed protein product [Timema genevievae]